MPLFTILLSILLVQVILSISLFWERKGGLVLLLHVMAQMVCWSLFKHFDEPSTLFTFGIEKTAFWANILLGLVWVDWSLQSRWLKGLFIGLIGVCAVAALLVLFSTDFVWMVDVSQIACQILLGVMLALTIRQQADISLSAFLGGWLGLIAIHFWAMASGFWLDEPVDLSAQLIGAFIVSCAACFRMVWMLQMEQKTEMQKLRDDLQARDDELNLRQEEMSLAQGQMQELQKEFQVLTKDLNRSQNELFHQAKTTSLGHSSLQINQQLQGILIGGMNRLRRIIHVFEENGHKETSVVQQLQTVLKNMDQATQLTSSMQKFGGSRKEGGETLLNVQTWLKEVVCLCEQRMQKSEIYLEIKDEAGDPWVKGRVADLMHALLILLNNACEALEYSEVKRITIELHRVVHDQQEWLRVTISDSGQGVPTNIRERIFQPFFSTKHQGQGSGLGLTIASRIFADHGGAIQLDAEALATTFIVQLPLQEQAPLQDLVR